MSTALEQRIVELETRLAFQEQALAELSDALAAARIEAAGHADLLQRTLEAMKQSRGELYADPSEEPPPPHRSEEHTSELQSLMGNSYAVFGLKQKTKKKIT